MASSRLQVVPINKLNKTPSEGPSKCGGRSIAFGMLACGIPNRTLETRLAFETAEEEKPMSEPGSVTQWIPQLKEGDRAAAQALWEGYYRQLVARARAKLSGAPRRAADEEDVALSAFDSFFRAAEQGLFPQLHDRHDLWQLLMLIADRKAINLIHAERRQRRGGGKVLDEAALAGGAATVSVTGLAWVPGEAPSPEFAAEAADEYRRLLHVLADANLQRVAVLKMAGYSVAEIAAEIARAPRTIKRWLQLVRHTWEQELQE